MKKLNIKLLLAVSLFTVISCSKDNDSATPTFTVTDFTDCKVLNLTNDNYKIVYAYNSNGSINTISEYYTSDLTTPIEVYTYTHKSGTITYTSKSGREQGNYTINASGRVTTSNITQYNGPDPTSVTSELMTSYEYDANGNLIKRTVTSENPAESTTTTYTYIWVNGNITNEISVSQSGSTSNTAYTYYTDKLNAFSSLTSLIDFTGPDSKNLIKASSNSISGSIYESYTYEFDAAGKPLKIIITDNSNTYNTFATFMCP
ncbi:MAG: hypothetical protein ACK44D_06555 [Bacteroidia bacterium]